MATRDCIFKIEVREIPMVAFNSTELREAIIPMATVYYSKEYELKPEKGKFTLDKVQRRGIGLQLSLPLVCRRQLLVPEQCVEIFME